MGFDLKKEAKFLSTRMDDKTAASVGLGAALMLVFGLGTSVCMLVFGLLGDALTRKYNKYILKVSTVLIITMGLMLTMKGIKML